MIYTEDKLSAENAEECWKRIKTAKWIKVVFYQFRYNAYVPVNPWKSPVQRSLNTSGTGQVLHFRALINSYKKSLIEENVTERHKISAPENYEFRISTVIFWQNKYQSSLINS